ncbi:hypothetical protein TeGR_g473 [Tetraparma gracilis]|uniref:Uncharacterized protein n=1 Tax=Tetraparma gracilis TaxID=2962635 RepID=A0ABQ6MZ28_9STRA|nr:hypothetical protein TeGR_g473 [Tetraparma gracilis]
MSADELSVLEGGQLQGGQLLGGAVPSTASKPPVVQSSYSAGNVSLLMRFRPLLMRLFGNPVFGNPAPAAGKGKPVAASRRSPLVYLLGLFLVLGSVMTVVIVERSLAGRPVLVHPPSSPSSPSPPPADSDIISADLLRHESFRQMLALEKASTAPRDGMKELTWSDAEATLGGRSSFPAIMYPPDAAACGRRFEELGG